MIKRIISILMAVLMIFGTSACSDGGKEKVDDSSKDNQKALTVAVRYTEEYMEAAVRKFQGEHPDIKVEVKGYSAATIATSDKGVEEAEVKRAKKAEEDYRKIISTELMSGDGADIIDITSLSYRKFIDKDVLANMSELIKSDSSFDLSMYQRNILDACKYKDNLYMMPLNFSFRSFLANKNIIKKENLNIDSNKWTWEEFLAIAQQITKDTNGDGKPDQYAFPKMAAENIFKAIYIKEGASFVDYSKKAAKFDSKEFIELFNFARDFASKKVCSPTVDMSKIYQFTDPGSLGFIINYVESYNAIELNQAMVNGEAEILHMPSYSGDINPEVFEPGTTFAINNNSELKTEAWEFIKILLSDEIQSLDKIHQFPLNLKAQEEQAKKVMERDSDFYKQKGRDVKPVTQADIDIVNKFIGELKTIPYTDATTDQIVYEGAEEFFSGKKSAEEAAKLIQSKVDIYLGE